MNVRTVAVLAGLAVAVLTAGCVASVAGQAEVDPAAIVAGSSSSSSTEASSTSNSDDESPSSVVPLTGTTLTIGSGSTLVLRTSLTVTARTRISDDRSVPLATTSIPGVSADCNRVTSALTAFSTLVQGSGDSETISAAAVATTLAAMPASGLPAEITPDMTVLRALVSSAAGKSVNELALGLADGKAISALEDISSWIAAHCA